MAWPTSDVPTTNLDSGADNPANARADLLLAAQNLNTIKSARGTAGGIAPTDLSNKVPIENLPVGTGASQVAAGNHNHSGTYQPADDDLTAIAGLSVTGMLVRTATNSWALRTLAAPSAGLTITNPAGIAGNPTFALANDLAALEGLTGVGLARRTGTDAWALVKIGLGEAEVVQHWMLGSGAYQNLSFLDASATWNPASLASGAQTSTTVTVPGAALGDFVLTSCDTALSGLHLWGEVTATDTVTLYLSNATGGAVDLASSTFYVRVMRRTP
jgi:hypothetical protein